MPETEKKTWVQVIEQKPIIAVLVLLVIVVIPVIAAVLVVQVQIAPLVTYDPTFAQKYEVKTMIFVEHLNGSEQWIGLDETYFGIDNRPEERLFIAQYAFLNEQNGLNATFDNIFIVYIIPEAAYNAYAEIECRWKIIDGEEINEGIGRKSSGGFDYEGVDYRLFIDIENIMWKTAVPQEIESSVTLYSR